MSPDGGILPHDWYPQPLPHNVVIGERSWLYSSFAFVHYSSRRPVGVRLGSDTGVYNGSFFELGEHGEVEIGDFCTIVGAVINANRRVEIHDYAFIAHEVHICDHPTAVPPGPGARTGSAPPPLVIGQDAWIGARAIIVGDASIGDGAIVGAGAVVTAPVPPHMTVVGNPARVVGGSTVNPSTDAHSDR